MVSFSYKVDVGKMPALRIAVLTAMSLAVVAVVAGCHPFDHYDQSLRQPLPPAMEPPREKAKMSLPAYRVEPPDLLQIEMLKLVPLPPYRIDIYDVLQIQAAGTLLDQPIDGFLPGRRRGDVNLGPAYGTVRVAGMTIEEATAGDHRAAQHRSLPQPEVSVQLARTAGTQPITGKYLVGPDGTINLRQYGMVHVAGKTLTEARAGHREAPRAVLRLARGLGRHGRLQQQGVLRDHRRGGAWATTSSACRSPATRRCWTPSARSTACRRFRASKIWIARPAPGGFGCEQILPVD